jgi:hypothetical protein
MDTIYTDRGQCEDFSVKYFGSGTLVVAADTLLRSKDYDAAHTSFLRSLGQRTLVLSRTEQDPIGPGWWMVQEVL